MSSLVKSRRWSIEEMASDQSKLERVSPPAIGVRGYRIRDLAKAEERRREILMGAARAYQANVSAVQATKSMIASALTILG